MKPLEQEITKNGFTYIQLQATPHAYMYAQCFKGTDKAIAYEVFQRRVNKAYTIAGNDIPESIAFPGNEAFGAWAYTYMTMEKARERFAELDRPTAEPDTVQAIQDKTDTATASK